MSVQQCLGCLLVQHAVQLVPTQLQAHDLGQLLVKAFLVSVLVWRDCICLIARVVDHLGLIFDTTSRAHEGGPSHFQSPI